MKYGQDGNWINRVIIDRKSVRHPLWQELIAVTILILIVISLLWLLYHCFNKTDNLVEEVMTPEANAYMQKPPLKSEIETVVPEKPAKKKPKKYVRKGKWQYFNVSHYCPCRICCGKWSDGRFKSGKKAYFGGIAAAKWYKPGTKIELKHPVLGTKVFKIEDTGRTIYGDRIDILIPYYMGGHKKALQLGRYDGRKGRPKKIKGRIIR